MLKEHVSIERKTRETSIRGRLWARNNAKTDIITPIGFLTHMLESFAVHGGFALQLHAEGDVHVDQHHLVEDVGLVLGQLFADLADDKRGLQRAGFFIMPMDDALARVAVDFGGRPFVKVKAQFKRRFCGELDLDLLPEFFRAFADQARVNLHIVVEYGHNDHHKVEAIFKAWARAIARALQSVSGFDKVVPSAKGVIE